MRLKVALSLRNLSHCMYLHSRYGLQHIESRKVALSSRDRVKEANDVVHGINKNFVESVHTLIDHIRFRGG